MGERLAKKVLLIGWDAADWQMITPLMDAGLMPTLEAFVNGGVMGNIATLQPALSPMLWTSIATGKRPYKHGILGFVEPNPNGQGIRPATSTSRTCKALWNILSQSGIPSHVIGWFASHPAEPIDGTIISDCFLQQDEHGRPAPLSAGMVHPPELAAILDPLRMAVEELGAGHLLPFVPEAAKVLRHQDDSAGDTALRPGRRRDPRLVLEHDNLLGELAGVLAECATVHNTATWLMEHRPWEFMAVYYEAIDLCAHYFMNYHPPRLPSVDPERFEIYKDVMNGMYRYHDMMLERLLQLAGEDTTVILCSDHGFISNELRPIDPELCRRNPTLGHRDMGILCMKGPGIHRDERIYGASLLDITPTVLTLFGLPVADDMDGRPLRQCFEKPVTVQSIPSWEQVEGESGMHPPERREDPYEAHQAIRQLVALGYIDEPSADQQEAAARAAQEARTNLGRSLMAAGKIKEAITVFEAALRDNSADEGNMMCLARCLTQVDRLSEARVLVQRVLDSDKPRPRANLLMASMCEAEGRTDEALAYLKRAEATDHQRPEFHDQIGKVYLRLDRYAEAEEAFRTVLKLDEDSHKAYDGLAMALLWQDRNEEAAEAALTAVGLVHFFPEAHFRLGVALTRMHMPQRAIQAFETALSMKPDFAMVHTALAYVLDQIPACKEKAAEHRRLAQHFASTTETTENS